MVYRLIMSLAERLSSKFHICPRSFASRPNVHFSDNLSAADIISRAHYQPIYQPPEGVYLLSNSSSFTSNLCGFPNGVFIRNRLTRRDSSPLTRTFTSKRVSLGEKYVCVDGELRGNHRQKLGLVC